MVRNLKRPDLILPDLSYEIIGSCFDVYHEIGGKHKELYLQRAIAVAFSKKGLLFKQQVVIPLTYQGVKVGKYILDFIVGDSVVVELKSSGKFRKQDYEQTKQYLINSGLSLGLLIRFSEDGVTYQRILPPTKLL